MITVSVVEEGIGGIPGSRDVIRLEVGDAGPIGEHVDKTLNDPANHGCLAAEVSRNWPCEMVDVLLRQDANVLEVEAMKRVNEFALHHVKARVLVSRFEDGKKGNMPIRLVVDPFALIGTFNSEDAINDSDGKTDGKRILKAVFVVERDGSDHVEDPQGNVIDEATLSPRHRKAIQGQRAVKSDGHRWRIFLYDYV